MPRWKFTDPTTADEYVFAQNPAQMTKPPDWASRGYEASRTRPGGPFRVVRALRQTDWEFSGKLRSEAQYDAFVLWAAWPRPFVITDHFLREFPVLPVAFDPQDFRSKNDWVHSYTFRVRAVLE